MDSRVLFTFSWAHLMVLLGNLPAEQLHDAWRPSRQTALKSGIQAAAQLLVDKLNDSDEARFFKN